jgi:hypothetical protein
MPDCKEELLELVRALARLAAREDHAASTKNPQPEIPKLADKLYEAS